MQGCIAPSENDDEWVDGVAFAELDAALSASGPRAALRYLNRRTRFRFTALYRNEAAELRGLFLVDRENPTIGMTGDAYARAVRDRTVCYAGVPLVLAGGGAGTLCHFDQRPRVLVASERTLLDRAGPLFAGWLGTLARRSSLS